MALGILAALLDFSGAAADEFHEWYDTEHVPERLRIPGFRNAQRWIGATEPELSLALFDLDHVDVLRTEAYRAILGSNVSPWARRMMGQFHRRMRVAAEQLRPGDALAPTGAAGLLLIGFNIQAEIEPDFNAWYDTEHLPALAAVPGVLCARRFRAVEGSPRYFAVYHLTAPEVPDSPAWRRATDTAWSARIRPHFRDRVRLVCRPYRGAP